MSSCPCSVTVTDDCTIIHVESDEGGAGASIMRRNCGGHLISIYQLEWREMNRWVGWVCSVLQPHNTQWSVIDSPEGTMAAGLIRMPSTHRFLGEAIGHRIA